MRNKYVSSRGGGDGDATLPPPGNYRRHDPSRCVCCARMTDRLTRAKITKTGREYQIRRHYTCVDTHLVYLATCLICQSQYVGQTSNEMRKRHYGHRSEIKRRSDGLGAHFHDHAVAMGLDLRKSREMDNMMDNFQLSMVGSVQQGQSWTQV